MGSPASERGRRRDERQHRVCLEDYSIGKYEVTFEEYDRFAKATRRKMPSDEGWGRGRRPVVKVSWRDAIAFAEWLSAQTGRHYRLPTEAEWEYAARAGTSGPFSFSGKISTGKVNYNGKHTYGGSKRGTFRKKTVKAGTLPSNPWGLHEMYGNVWEWTCSAYDAGYKGKEQKCASSRDSYTRVLRGGSWAIDPKIARSASRSRYKQQGQSNEVGFRLALD